MVYGGNRIIAARCCTLDSCPETEGNEAREYLDKRGILFTCHRFSILPEAQGALPAGGDSGGVLEGRGEGPPTKRRSWTMGSRCRTSTASVEKSSRDTGQTLCSQATRTRMQRDKERAARIRGE